MNQQVEEQAKSEYKVLGPLTFDTVVTVEKQGINVINQSPNEITFDLSAVTHVSSAAAVMLLSWLRLSKAQKKTVRFVHLNEQFKAIIHGLNLQTLLLDDC